MRQKRIEKVKEIFEKQGGIIKSAVLRENKLCSKDIAELVAGGYISRVKTGYYTWIHDNTVSDLTVAVAVVKNGVICLLSAAQYHELTTVNRTVIDVAVPAGGKPPVLPIYPPIQLHRFRKSHFDLGISRVSSDHDNIQIYDKERTICDLFRMRNKYGIDIALEVLKTYMNGKDVRIQRLYEYAEKMRVKSVIKPYVEALL
jgi:predicted transcriptional regulator of viral defense system